MNTKKKTRYQNNNILTQKGGTKIDQGAFGCVITPYISCPKNKNKIKSLNHYHPLTSKKSHKLISKLLFTQMDSSDQSDFINEIKVYSKIKLLDPKMLYFIIPINICYLENISSQRKDIEFIKYYKNIYGEIDYDFIIQDGRKKRINIDSPSCYLDKALHPINMIFPYAGISFSNLSINNHYISEIFQHIFYHLCQAIHILHHHQIVHSDIKPDNIMCDTSFLTKNNVNKILKSKAYKPLSFIKLIDFGMSNIINKSNIIKKNIIYSYHGTETFIAPDMIISHNLYHYSHQDLITDIKQFIQNYRDLKMESYLNLQISNIKENITRIETLINDNTYESLFGKTIDGFIYKYDIYALGISMIMIAEDFNVNISIPLKDLLQKMTDFNPITRLNIDQVLTHPYFN